MWLLGCTGWMWLLGCTGWMLGFLTGSYVVVRVYWVDIRVFDWFLGGCYGVLGGC